jgi:Protein of unknown function (DUF4231)
MTPDEYIAQRVKQYQGWYDRKAVTAKQRHLLMRCVSVISGSIVPVLVNIEADILFCGFSLSKITVTLLSLSVVVCVALEGVLHYREQWKNYRSTEQFLGHETISFRTSTDIYRDKNEDEQFNVFVERIESAIRSENAATLNIMTIATEQTSSR